jgi:hypothetical protein
MAAAAATTKATKIEWNTAGGSKAVEVAPCPN